MIFVIYVYNPNKFCFVRAHTSYNSKELGAWITDKGLDAPTIIRSYPAWAIAPDRIQPWDVDSFVDSGLGFIDAVSNT